MGYWTGVAMSYSKRLGASGHNREHVMKAMAQQLLQSQV